MLTSQVCTRSTLLISKITLIKRMTAHTSQTSVLAYKILKLCIWVWSVDRDHCQSRHFVTTQADQLSSTAVNSMALLICIWSGSLCESVEVIHQIIRHHGVSDLVSHLRDIIVINAIPLEVCTYDTGNQLTQ